MNQHRAARLLVIQPDEADPLGNFDGWLRDDGIEIDTVRPFDGDPIPADLGSDAVIVLGGNMSSLDDADYPWLDDVRRLIRRSAAQRLPTLGICLGAQLMAQAFGGTTATGSNGLEAGVVEVRWRGAAAADVLFRDLPNSLAVGTMHSDIIDVLPPGSAWLGQSAPYPHQVFRVGASAWGVQFHPEIDYRRYGRWVEMFAGTDEAYTHRLRLGAREFCAAETRILSGTRLIARRFADLIHERAARTAQSQIMCGPATTDDSNSS